jgi:hypothetical protein
MFFCAPQSVLNCGFVAWKDPEWPQSLQKSLELLWEKYDETKNMLYVDKRKAVKLIQTLTEEKNHWVAEYNSLNTDINFWLNKSTKQVMVANLKKYDAEKKYDMERDQKIIDLEKENEKLKEEVALMKEVQKSDMAQREALKEEKKKLEYNLYDLLQVSEGHKEKLKIQMDKLLKIKDLCDE